MHYIVLDLEWNQSPTGNVVRNDNGILPFEILEIGAVKLDSEKKVISSFDRLIRPQVYLKMHKVVEKMLPITMKMLMKGKDFKTAYKEFEEWCGSDFCFCTWGDLDLIQLQRNMAFYGIENKFPMPFVFLDLQNIYSLQYLDGNQMPSLEKAVKALGIHCDIEYHRAVHDARYTALVMQSLSDDIIEQYKSIDTYRIPKRASEEIYYVQGGTEQYISKGFAKKERATKNRALRRSECFLCGNPMTREIRWFCDNGRNYHAAFRCAEHGIIIGKFRIKQSDKGFYYAVRTLSLSDKNGINYIMKRREHEKLRLKQIREKNKFNEERKGEVLDA